MTDRAENSAFMSALPYAPPKAHVPSSTRPHVLVTFYWLDWYYEPFVRDPGGLSKLNPDGPFSQQARYYPAHANEPALLVFTKPYGVRDRPLRTVEQAGLEILRKHGVPTQIPRP